MAGLQELRFPEEKPLLRGQDVTELVSRPFQVLGAVRHLVVKREIACFLAMFFCGTRENCPVNSELPRTDWFIS